MYGYLCPTLRWCFAGDDERLLDGLLAGAAFFLLLVAIAAAVACYLTNSCRRLQNIWRRRSNKPTQRDNDHHVWHSRTTTFISRPASYADWYNSSKIHSPEDGFVNPGFDESVPWLWVMPLLFNLLRRLQVAKKQRGSYVLVSCVNNGSKIVFFFIAPRQVIISHITIAPTWNLFPSHPLFSTSHCMCPPPAVSWRCLPGILLIILLMCRAAFHCRIIAHYG